MVELNDHYNDRGMKKYSGFYISEHTTEIDSSEKNRKSFNQQKPRMDLVDIYTLIGQANLKSERVIVQIEAVDQEGHYFDDIVGKIMGHDGLGVYIGTQKVGYDEIRHIEFDRTKKWSDLTDR